MISYQFEQGRRFSLAPLGKDNGLCSVISGDSREAQDIVGRGAGCGSTFGLDQDNVEKVSPFQSAGVIAMILADCEEVDNAASLGLGSAAKVHQVPSCAGSSAECDKPFGHCARPLCRVLGLLAGSHVMLGLGHLSYSLTPAITRSRRRRKQNHFQEASTRLSYGFIARLRGMCSNSSDPSPLC